jgi:hypothetical protein
MPKKNTPTGWSNPSQYALPEGAKELQDIIEAKDMNWNMANCFKAIYRDKENDDPLYDEWKVLWFICRELKRKGVSHEEIIARLGSESSK